jgi:hypothetical protein
MDEMFYECREHWLAILHEVFLTLDASKPSEAAKTVQVCVTIRFSKEAD